jgi:hypothetical protein
VDENPRKQLSKVRELLEKTADAQVQVAEVNPDELASNYIVEVDPKEILEKNTVKRPIGRPKGSVARYGALKRYESDELKKAKDTLWRKGILAEMKLDKAQLDLYRTFKNRTDSLVVWVASRQMGKSFSALVTVLEACMQNPGIRVAYISPQKAQTRDVVEKNMMIILADCPDALRPKYDQQRGFWRFKNASLIKVAGIDGGHVESIRGQTFDIVVVDEAGFPNADDFKYAIEDVIFPTMTRAENPVILLFSTPPVNYDHPFNDYWEKAELTGNLAVKTIYDTVLPKKQIQDIESRYGIDSIGFRREYLVQRIADTNTLVVPEATPDLMEEIIREHKRPAYFKPYVTADYGVMDLNAVLFGYYDFQQDLIVIEDELKMSGAEYDTARMAKDIRTKEIELWGEYLKPDRYCDNNLQIIRDFVNLHNLTFLATDKTNKQAHVNVVRTKINGKRIIINPKCTNLIQHLQNAVWDKDRKKFRKAIGHHYDFLDCLIYLVRNINYTHNPFPENYFVKGEFISPKLDELRNKSEFVRHLSKMFTPRKPSIK